MLGLKYYPILTVDVLTEFIFEYGILQENQLERIIKRRFNSDADCNSLMLKLRRVAQLSHYLKNNNELVYIIDFENTTIKQNMLERSIWVLIDYLEEIDYHFCCSNPGNGNIPSICFGTKDSHYEVFYIPNGDEEFFHMLFDVFEKEMVYKVQIIKELKRSEDTYENSLLSTKRFIVLDDWEQINKLNISSVLAFCVIDEENIVQYQTAKGEKIQ